MENQLVTKSMKQLSNQLFLFSFILLNFTISTAQNEPLTFQYDEEGNVVYSEVVKIDNKDGIQLYNQAKDWFVENYNSANDVIQLDDKDRLKITGKGFFQLNIKQGMVKLQLDVYHTLSVQSKDDRYRYEISQIYWKWNSTTISKCKNAEWTLNSERIAVCMNKKQLIAMKENVDLRINQIIS